ncbi:hypothetical protein LTR84_006523 [Exophiala bonariae]|uniref:DUF1330 domain-containing protein n=1 Tax=Exophiala bonariae TaxID=1690606 RepID=A0AAV9N0B1_9EURO|nr:hypothetical protein LTR84_006523 [Exophiala bonariae]
MATTNSELYLGDLEAATSVIPNDRPYIMMNLMNFKPHARYASNYRGPRSDSMTGREAYVKYKDMFVERATEMGLEVSMIFLGTAHTQIVAVPEEGESWDLIIIVKYASWQAFKSVLVDKKYNEEIQPHRIASLQEFRSFGITELSNV